MKKYISCTTIICFFFSCLGAPALQGAVDVARDSRRINAFQSAVNTSGVISDIDVPTALGRVTALNEFNSDTLVVNIQDLHCHANTQRNIADIISFLDKNYSLEHVYVEGGYGNIDTSWLTAIADAGARRQIQEGLLNQGRLSGAEYYSMNTRRFGLLKGIEDEKLHKENIVRLGRILEKRNHFDTVLREMSRDMDFMMQEHCGARNRRLNSTIAAYRSGSLDPEQYYRRINKYIEQIHARPADYNNLYSLRLENYPAITAYMEFLKLQKHVSYRLASRQLQALMLDMKTRLSFSAYNTLLTQTDNLTDYHALYLQLQNIEKEHNLAVRRTYPALYDFLRIVDVNRMVNPLDLIKENRRLVEELRFAFSGDVVELEVSFLNDFFQTFSDYLRTNISAEDHAYFASRFNQFRMMWGKHVYRNRLNELSSDFPLLDEYYAVNIRRNEVFLKHVLPPVAAPRSGRRPVIVIVAGGFHAEGISRLLGEKRVSNCIITPMASMDDGDSSKVFTSQIRQQSKMISSHALSLTLPSCDAKVVDVSGTTIRIQLNGTSDQLAYVYDGARWNLHVPPDAGMYAQDDALVDHIQQITTAVNEAVAMAAAVVPDRIGYTSEVVAVLVTAFGAWGANHGLWGSNGLIWRIAMNENVREHLQDDIDRVARLPIILQESELFSAEKQINIERLSDEEPVLAAVLETNGSLFYDVWRFMHQTAETEMYTTSIVACENILRQARGLSANAGAGKYTTRLLREIRKVPAIDAYSQDLFDYFVLSLAGASDEMVKSSVRCLEAFNANTSLHQLVALPSNREKLQIALLELLITSQHAYREITDRAVIQAVLQLISEHGDERVIGPLLTFAEDAWGARRDDVAENLVMTAAQVNRQMTVDALFGMLQTYTATTGADSRKVTRDRVKGLMEAVAIIAETGPVKATADRYDLLRGVMKDAKYYNDRSIRVTAARALHAFGVPSPITRSSLLNALDYSTENIQLVAMHVLQRDGDLNLLPVIMKNRDNRTHAETNRIFGSILRKNTIAEIVHAISNLAEQDLAIPILAWCVTHYTAFDDAGAKEVIIDLLCTPALKNYIKSMSIQHEGLSELSRDLVSAAYDPHRTETGQYQALYVMHVLNDTAVLTSESRRLEEIMKDTHRQISVRARAAALLALTGDPDTQFERFYAMHSSADEAEQACGYAGLASLAMGNEDASVTLGEKSNFTANLMSWAKHEHPSDIEQDLVFLCGIGTASGEVESYVVDHLKNNADFEVRVQAAKSLEHMLSLGGMEALFQVAYNDTNAAVRTAAINAIVSIIFAELHKPTNDELIRIIKISQQGKLHVLEKVGDATIATINLRAIWNLMRYLTACGLEDDTVYRSLSHIMKKLSHKQGLSSLTGLVIPYLRSDDEIVVAHAEEILSHACTDPQVLAHILALMKDPNMQVPVMHTLSLAFAQYKGKIKLQPEMFDVNEMQTHEAQTFAALLRASFVQSGGTAHDASMMYRWCLRVLSDSELKYKKLAYQLIEQILISIAHADVTNDEIEAAVDPLVAVINSTELSVTADEKRYAAKILILLSTKAAGSRNSTLLDLGLFSEISKGNPDETEEKIVNYVLYHAAPLLKRIGFQSPPASLQHLLSALSVRNRKISLVDEGEDLLIFLNSEFRKTVDRMLSDRRVMQGSLLNNPIGYYGLAIAAARLLRQYNIALNDEAMRISARVVCEHIKKHWDDVVLDSDTVFLGIYGDERHRQGTSFSSEHVRRMMADREIEPAKKTFTRTTDPHEIYAILRAVLRDGPADKKLIWLSSHGNNSSLNVSDVSSTRLLVAECAEVFSNAAEKGVDLSKVTVIIDSCRSHNFSITLLALLSEKGIKSLPKILSVSEKDRSGYSNVGGKSNFESAVAKQMRMTGRRGKMTLHEFIQAGLITDRQDSSIFVPIDSDTVALMLSDLPRRGLERQPETVAGGSDTDQITPEARALLPGPIALETSPGSLKSSVDILQVNMNPRHVARLAIAGGFLIASAIILGSMQIVGVNLLPALIAVGGLYAALSPFVHLEKKWLELRFAKTIIFRFINSVQTLFGTRTVGPAVKRISLGNRLSLVSGEASTSEDGRETEFVSADPSASEIRVVPAHFEVLSLLNTNPVTRFLMRVSLYTNGTVGHETYHILNPTKGEARPFIYTQALPAIVGYTLFVSAGLLLGLPGIPIIVTGLIFGTRAGIGLAGLKLNMDLNREVRNISFAWIINHDTHYQDRVTLSNETAFVPVVVTDVKPDGWDENRTDIVSLGKTNDGQAVWGASEHNHLIIYCTENPLSTAKYVQGQLTPTAAMKGNASLARGLMTLVHRTAGRHSFADASDMTFDPGIYVQSDERSHEMSYAYDSDGEMVVTVAKDGVKTMDADALRSLRAIQSGDNVAMARSFIFRLDDAGMVEDIQTILSLRGQQVLVTGIEKAHKVQAVIQTLQKDHHMNLGIRVFAMVNESDAVERTRELAGCVMVTASGKKTFHDNTFPDSEGILASEDRAAMAPIWIVNVSALTSELNNGRFFDKVGVTKMFGANVLAFFRGQVYSERYVRDAVYGFTVDEFTTAQTRMHFLNAMKSIVDDKKYAVLTETFDKAVAERKHVEEWIAEKSSRSPIPLHHKQMLGTALSLKNEQKGLVQTIDENHGQLTEEGINIAFQAMRTDPKPSTIEALIALIELYDMQFADFNIQRLIIDANEARNITAILSAA